MNHRSRIRLRIKVGSSFDLQTKVFNKVKILFKTGLTEELSRYFSQTEASPMGEDGQSRYANCLATTLHQRTRWRKDKQTVVRVLCTLVRCQLLLGASCTWASLLPGNLYTVVSARDELPPTPRLCCLSRCQMDPYQGGHCLLATAKFHAQFAWLSMRKVCCTAKHAV